MDFESQHPERTPHTADSSPAEPAAHIQAQAGWESCEMPAYLTQHYQWAYLMRGAVWFFDHQPVINCILFGNYRKIMDHTLRLIDAPNAGKTLQVASVYGDLVPRLATEIDDLHVIDVAPIQLDAAARKLRTLDVAAELRRMNAEEMSYASDTFDTAVMFLLLHEMPPEARLRTLGESIRVLRRDGRLVIAEFGERKAGHFIHRFAPMRWLLTKSEPFLADFWETDLVGRVEEAARHVGKRVSLESKVDVFGGFYRVMSFRVA